jgi:hypothetical protein
VKKGKTVADECNPFHLGVADECNLPEVSEKGITSVDLRELINIIGLFRFN